MRFFRKATKKNPRFLHSVDGKDTGPSLRLGSYQASNWLYGSYPRVSISHWLFFLTIHTIEPRAFCLFSALLTLRDDAKRLIVLSTSDSRHRGKLQVSQRFKRMLSYRVCYWKIFRCCWISFWKSTTPLFLPKFWRIMKVNKQKAVMRWDNLQNN